ncbi:MAG: hypothetical protein ACFE95_11120 [Candidatus Hodarchaeota archaeon]
MNNPKIKNKTIENEITDLIEKQLVLKAEIDNIDYFYLSKEVKIAFKAWTQTENGKKFLSR